MQEADLSLDLMSRIQAQLRQIETKMHSQIGELGELQSKSIENLRQSQQEELQAVHAQTAEISRSVQKLSGVNGWGGSEAGTEPSSGLEKGAATIPIPPEFASPAARPASPTATERIVNSVHQCQTLSEQFLALKAEMDDNQQRATSLQDVVEELSTALLTKAQEARGLASSRGLSPSGSTGELKPAANGASPLNVNLALANSTNVAPRTNGPVKGESLRDLYAKLNGEEGGGINSQGTEAAEPILAESEKSSPEKPKVVKKNSKTSVVKKVAKATKTTKATKTKVTKKK